MSSTQERRRLVRELLAGGTLRSQDELRAALAALGVEVSQPVLSRDLRSLGAAKRDGVYELAAEERVTPLAALSALLRRAEPASHFLVVGCEPGAGASVARALEAEQPAGLVGTVAGDDTVLVALASSAAAQRVQRLVRDLL